MIEIRQSEPSFRPDEVGIRSRVISLKLKSATAFLSISIGYSPPSLRDSPQSLREVIENTPGGKEFCIELVNSTKEFARKCLGIMSAKKGLDIVDRNLSSLPPDEQEEAVETATQILITLVNPTDGLIDQRAQALQNIAAWMQKAHSNPQMRRVSNIFLSANSIRGGEKLKNLARQVHGGLLGVSNGKVDVKTLDFYEIVEKLEATEKDGLAEEGLEAAFAFCLGSQAGGTKMIKFARDVIKSGAEGQAQ